ncbi:MAG: right-handed parallel beta-helix repeat-containing protein [Planctomycetota bacterium]|nr:right-handed parallel beta-helix repeat-containing protein [Planctomycetota bacterium]
MSQSRLTFVVWSLFLWNIPTAFGGADTSQISPQNPPAILELPQIVVSDDNTRITKSCRLIVAPRPLIDADKNGVIQIEGDDITVDFCGQTLMGAEAKTPQDELQGIGIVAQGKRITIRNGTVTGFQIGISAKNCDNALFESMQFIRNFAQRLASNPERENVNDWLSPQKNDNGEWVSQYGAAIAVSDSQGIVMREIGVRQGQNGIVLSRVSNSQVYNCDASFLSGWGIALWRSCSNTICRNSFDFCIRGYSHNIYNRGQDSAGILCFEQSSDNTIMLNSATHCGDGFFSFAGREALGETLGEATGAGSSTSNLGQGCNRNLIALNDFSDAAAHGLESTFSFDNRIFRNRFDRDAICGIWGGYSQRLQIRGNVFRANGDAGVGGENGGINIEHGRDAVIADNVFSNNSAGIRLWWDEDAHLAKLPWAKANGVESTGTLITRNTLNGGKVGVFLRSSPGTIIESNTMTKVGIDIDADEISRAALKTEQTPKPTTPQFDWSEFDALAKSLPGTGNAVEIEDGLPISKRNPLAGRAAIVIGEFGPFDFIAPMAVYEPGQAHMHRWKLLGSQPIQFLQATQGHGDLRANIDPATSTAIIETETLGFLTNYELAIFWGQAPDQVQRVRGTLLSTNWRVEVFELPKPASPGAMPNPLYFDQLPKDTYRVYIESLTFPFGVRGPDAVNLMPTSPTVPKDNFGIRATTTFSAAPGDWIVQTESDDGVRVLLDGKILIDNWNRHGNTIDQGRFSIREPKDVTMTVLYFELDGEAKLDLRVLPAPPTPLIPKQIAP